MKQHPELEHKLTTRQIVDELNKYIVGQNEAKKTVAIALRNRWRRLYAPDEIKQEIMPNNILMIGSTGIGKTEIARRLAKLADAPFVKVEASKFTEVGYVGRDVESMVRDLVEQSFNIVRSSKKEEQKIKAEERVEELILDILIPPVKQSEVKKIVAVDATNGEIPTDDTEINMRTREKFRKKIKNGDLDERKIEIKIQQSSIDGIGVVAPPGIDESSMMNIQEMISGMMPKRSKTKSVTVKEARKILYEEEVLKLIDHDALKEDAITKAENSGIIFIDEIDKIANSGGKGAGPDISREGVQRDLLPIVEGSNVNTKYGIVKTDHILFIAAGAFHVSKPSDLIPELQGRFPIRAELTALNKNDFYRILKNPKNSLTKQYIGLFESEGVKIKFTDSALELVAELACEVNEKLENIGARRLSTLMSKVLNGYLYDVPDIIKEGTEIIITKEIVGDSLSTIVKNRDLSHYIL